MQRLSLSLALLATLSAGSAFAQSTAAQPTQTQSTASQTPAQAAAAKRANPVAPAQRSNEALNKAARKRTDDDTPVHSFTTLLADLATICANHIQPNYDVPPFTMITTPTPLQRRAFELLDVSHRHGMT